MKDLKEIALNTQAVYQQEAKAYAAQRGQSLFEKQWLDLFLSNIKKGDAILDVCCGSGKPIAEYFIRKGYSVSGIDYSENMIELARGNFPDNKWIKGNMIELNLGEEFSGIIAWNSFFHLTHGEQKKALGIFSEHLVEGGVFLFTAGPEAGEVIGQVNGRDVYHSSLSVAGYKEELEKNDMRLAEFRLNDPDCNGHSVFLARKE